jgi:hypothetical protein
MPENIACAEPTAASDDPGRDECLRCYLIRMIRAHGCDNTKTWTNRWRERHAPRDQRLIERLEERGGICCDCEVIFNVWQHEGGDERYESRGPSACAGAVREDPLALCERWRDWSLSEPSGFYDDDDDYEPDDYKAGGLANDSW